MRAQRYKRQRGATLLIGLVVLIALSVLTISAIRISSVNLKIVGNVQAKNELNAAAQIAINKVISTPSLFYTPAAQTVNVDTNNDGVTDYIVTVAAPVCIQSTPAEGYSYNPELPDSAPKYTFWEIHATASDSRTGAAVDIHQGVKILMASTASC